jgi:hypothetical protein
MSVDWTKVVTHPLGLTAFALLVLFCLAKSIRQPAWLKKVFVAAAVIVIVGGLFLAYQQSTPDKQDRPEKSDPTRIQQQTTGQNSPAVQGVDGDVNIIIEQDRKQK